MTNDRRATPLPAEPPPPGSPGEFHFPAFTENRLGNGLRVVVCEDRRVPRVCGTMLVTTGLMPEEQRLPGLSAVLAAMLKEGTATRTADEIAEAVDFMGAELETSGNQDMVQASISMLDEYFADGLGLLADLVLELTLPDDELERLRRRELAALAAKHAQPGYLGRKACYHALYGEHPYAAVDATEDSLTAISRDQLVAFHHGHFEPSRACLVVVGSVTRRETLRVAETLFGAWSAAKPTEPLAAEVPPITGRRVVIVDFPNAVQSNIFVANHALPYGHPDYVGFKVMNQILGGSYASRLFMNLREAKGYTYGAYSRPDARVEAGSLVASAAVRNEVTEGALKEFFGEFDRIREDLVGADELANAKAFLTGVFPISLERIEEVAGHIVSLKLHGLPDTYWDTYREAIAAVTPGKAQAMAQRYVRPESMVIVVVGRADHLRPILEPYGPVTVLDKNVQLPGD